MVTDSTLESGDEKLLALTIASLICLTPSFLVAQTVLIQRTGNGSASVACAFDSGNTLISCLKSGGTSSQTCSTPDCSASISDDVTIGGMSGQSNLSMSGSASGANIQTSGSASWSPPAQCSIIGGIGPTYFANGTESVYALVPNGTPINVTINRTATASGAATAGTGTGRGGAQTSYSVSAGPGSITYQGASYYLIDSIQASGGAGAQTDCQHANSSQFTASIGLTFCLNVAKIIYASAPSRSGIVGTPLPSPLKVQVVNACTLAPISGLAVSFGVTSFPPGGQDYSIGSSAVSDSNGFASVPFTPGSATGVYNVIAIGGDSSGISYQLPFSINATTLQQALKLVLLNCDPSGIEGTLLPNPMSVEVLNTVTGLGEPNVPVTFGGIATGGGISGSDGEIDDSIVLPNAIGVYTASAHCAGCGANFDVSCSITSQAPPTQPPAQGPGVSPVPSQSTGNFDVKITFQPFQPFLAPEARAVQNSNLDHIGVFQGDTIRFGIELTPPQLNPNIQWSGVGSGNDSTIDVMFNSIGYPQYETVTVNGITATVAIEVGALPTRSLRSFCGSNPVAFAACGLDYANVFSLSQKALHWAESQAPSLPDGISGLHNGHADAIRHAYWNALMAATFGASTAQGISFGHEYDDINVKHHPHNDSLMDLDNNVNGINIETQFPPFPSEGTLQIAVMNALTDHQLIVLDEFNDNDQKLTGLMRKSNER